LWTTGTADSEIGVYDDSGNLKATDDDGDAGLLSALCFGTETPNRPAHGDGLAFNGRNGALSAGVYWLALGTFNSTFNATGWNVTSTGAATTGLCLNWADTNGLPPTGTGTATPS